jgi:redox-sensing transcriptional repressor
VRVTEFTDFVQGFTSGYGGGTQAACFRQRKHSQAR